MKWLKRLVLVLALLVVAAIVALLTVNPNHFKPLIEHAVLETTGRTLSLDGDLSLTWFPSLGLEFGPTRLGNPTGFGESPFARIERAVLRVDLVPLLQGALQIHELEIRGLTLDLQVDGEGKTNWRDLVLLFASESEQANGAALPVTLAGITVEDAALHFNDAVTDLDFSIAPIGLSTGPVALGEPVDLVLEFDASSTTPPVDAHFRVETTSRIDPGPVLTLADLKAAFSAEGEGLPLTLKEGQVAGTVAVDLNTREVSATPLQGVIVAASPEGVEVQIASTATGNGNLNTYRFELSDLRVNLDATGLPLADRWFSGSLASAITVDAAAKNRSRSTGHG